MSNDTIEYFFNCPYCDEEISFVLDLSVPEQTYTEDCEVCCNPIEVTFKAEDKTITFFEAKSIEQ